MFNYCKALAAEASKLAGRPVRVVLPREGVYRVVGGRAMTEQRVAIGADADGHFDSLIHTGATATTPQKPLPESVITMTRSLYEASNIKLDVQVAEMDIPNNLFMRAPGDAVGSFALECAIDELADQMGIDPIELRVRNEPKRNPTDGRPFSSRHLIEAYRLGADRFGWARRNWRPGTRREDEWFIGLGCATAAYPYVRIPGGAARLTLTKDGRARVEAAAHEMGMGTATVQTQIIAERLGLPTEKVAFAYGESSFPGDILAGASQQTVSVGAAVIAAHGELVSELLKLAAHDSPVAGLKPEEVDTLDGALCKIDEPSRRESYTSILTRANRDNISVEAKGPMSFEMLHWSMNSYGAQFCEVRVNAITGETRVSRFLGVFDCGRILNAKTAASQFRGGIIMGIGLALMEESRFDERNGRIMNPSLWDYHVPVHMDVPKIDVIWTDIPDPHAPMGARGIGEIGITGVGAAIANAVYHATGKRVRHLPITLDKLL
jgi:xanthine dehydrogenase YagR molybdenum-binding subunit